ncbi:MAG TPA: hypothetical protein VHT73_11005 [Thermodesulfobacteriota bacterium]|nr:hypothetical protein [Thermodesulfobacteriota bacterium]
MACSKRISMGGVENKEIEWVCESDSIQAEIRHPVQYAYIEIGKEEESEGKMRRVIEKRIEGAELFVFYEFL